MLYMSRRFQREQARSLFYSTLSEVSENGGFRGVKTQMASMQTWQPQGGVLIAVHESRSGHTYRSLHMQWASCSAYLDTLEIQWEQTLKTNTILFPCYSISNHKYWPKGMFPVEYVCVCFSIFLCVQILQSEDILEKWGHFGPSSKS